MNIATLKDRVLTKLGETDLSGFDIEAAAPSCLTKLAESVARSPDRQLLVKDFEVTVTSGIGDLTDALTAAEPLLISEIPSGNLYVTSGTTPLQFLPDRTQLGLTRPKMVGYYSIDNNNLRTRNTDGSLTSLNTTVTITGSYVPTLASVPDQLSDELVALVVEYLVGQSGG